MYKILKCDHNFGQVFKKLTLVGHVVLVENITEEQTQKKSPITETFLNLTEKSVITVFYMKNFRK